MIKIKSYSLSLFLSPYTPIHPENHTPCAPPKRTPIKGIRFPAPQRKESLT